MNNEKRQYNKKTSEVPDQGLMYGKIPPQAKEIESAILGAILLERGSFDVASEIVKADSFYLPANQKIFGSMEVLSKKGLPIDLLTICEELRKIEELEMVGGAYYISKLTNSIVSAANIDYHCRIIQEKFILRELGKMGSEISNDAYNDTTDAFELIDKAGEMVSTISSGNIKKPYVSMSSGLAKAIVKIEDLRTKDNNITGIPSGFASIDKVTHGWQNEDLIILAARPSVGKTAFAGNIAVNAAKFFVEEARKTNTKPKSVAFFSLEMSTGQLINRIISCESEIPLDKLGTGKVDDSEMKTIYQITEELNKLPIFFDDQGAQTSFDVRTKSRNLKLKHDVGLIIIDYLQLMSGVGKSKGNREQEISGISRDLKALAKELKVPILPLSQLSRATETRKGDHKMPQLSDLRESGAIEQDADMVMFLYRPEYYDVTANEFGDNNKGETHLKIAKHRNGSLETVKLKALLHIQKFIEEEQDFFKPADKLESSWKSMSEINKGSKMSNDFETEEDADWLKG